MRELWAAFNMRVAHPNSASTSSCGQPNIGHNVSSGCIRMRNTDVIDLYEHVKVGAKVVVL